MRNNREMLTVRVTPDQKNQLRRQAELAGKTMSEFVLDSAISQSQNDNSDTAKINYQTIKSEILEIKKLQYIMTRMLLFTGAEVFKSDETMQKIYNESKAEAESKFGNLEG
mgnify:CR=1 FL=1